MSSHVRERFNPVPLGANEVYETYGPAIGGFLAKTAGTITVKDRRSGTDVVDAVPVVEGVYLPIPMVFYSGEGGTITLAGGASGTLFV